MALALASTEDVAAVSTSVPQSDVARVTRLIEMVSGHVVNYTGQEFVRVVDDTITITPHDGELRLPQRPVTAVSSVTIGGTLIDPSQYTWQSNGIMRRTSPQSWAADSQFAFAGPSGWPIDGEWPWPPIATTIVHTRGYAAGDYPPEIAMVVAEKVAAKWLSGQRNAEGVQSESIDGYSQTFAKIAHISAGNAWDPEHKDILDDYRRAKFASLRLG